MYENASASGNDIIVGKVVVLYLSFIRLAHTQNCSSIAPRVQIPVNYWLWDGFRQSNTWDFGMFNDLLGEQRTEFTTPILSAPSEYNIAVDGEGVAYVIRICLAVRR